MGAGKTAPPKVFSGEHSAPGTQTDATPNPANPTPAPEATDKPALPDHLSTDPRSPHFAQAVFEHDVGIRFNGKERSDVEEYCISEGWIKVAAGKTVDRRGHPMLIKLKGSVEAFYK